MKTSIITIGLNNRDGYEKTLASVAGQTCEDYELIVIDGGSTDGSVDVIRRYENIIGHWTSEPDSGIYNAMNKGVARATGEYCIFMNSGDAFHAPDVLERFARQAGDKDIYSGNEQIGESGHIYCVPDRLTAVFVMQRGLPHQATFIRTRLLRENPYDEKLRIASDWKFFVEELVLRGRSYGHLEFAVSLFDTSGISYMAHNQDLLQQERRQVLEELLPERLREALMGRNKMEKRVLYALSKDNLWKRDTKILRNVLKRMPGDFFRTYIRRKRKG